VRRFLVTANIISTSPILVTLMMQASCSSETSVLIRATRRKFQEDGILHSHRRENIIPNNIYSGFNLILSVSLTLLTELGLGIHSASNRNKHQSRNSIYFWGIESGLCVRLNSKPSVGQIWDPQHLITSDASTACYGDSFTSLHSVLDTDRNRRVHRQSKVI
jgi:hypothetical protein